MEHFSHFQGTIEVITWGYLDNDGQAAQKHDKIKPQPSSFELEARTCSKLELSVKLETDMENIWNLTRAGFFISKFYLKVRELRQFHSSDKKHELTAIIMYTGWVTLPRLGNVSKAG